MPTIGEPLPLDGSLLGVDPGTKRVGLAVATILATVHPIGFVHAEPREAMLRAIAAAADDRQCVGIVVGLPINMDGSEGPAAQAARLLAGEIAVASGLPVDFCDERLTSFEAERKVAELGLTRKKKKARVDAVAAAAIVETYLQERLRKARNT